MEPTRRRRGNSRTVTRLDASVNNARRLHLWCVNKIVGDGRTSSVTVVRPPWTLYDVSTTGPRRVHNGSTTGPRWVHDQTVTEQSWKKLNMFNFSVTLWWRLCEWESYGTVVRRLHDGYNTDPWMPWSLHDRAFGSHGAPFDWGISQRLLRH